MRGADRWKIRYSKTSFPDWCAAHSLCDGYIDEERERTSATTAEPRLFEFPPPTPLNRERHQKKRAMEIQQQQKKKKLLFE